MGQARGFGEQERFARADILEPVIDQVDAGLALDTKIVEVILATLVLFHAHWLGRVLVGPHLILNVVQHVEEIVKAVFAVFLQDL